MQHVVISGKSSSLTKGLSLVLRFLADLKSGKDGSPPGAAPPTLSNVCMETGPDTHGVASASPGQSSVRGGGAQVVMSGSTGNGNNKEKGRTSSREARVVEMSCVNGNQELHSVGTEGKVSAEEYAKRKKRLKRYVYLTHAAARCVCVCACGLCLFRAIPAYIVYFVIVLFGHTFCTLNCEDEVSRHTYHLYPFSS